MQRLSRSNVRLSFVFVGIVSKALRNKMNLIYLMIAICFLKGTKYFCYKTWHLPEETFTEQEIRYSEELNLTPTSYVKLCAKIRVVFLEMFFSVPTSNFFVNEFEQWISLRSKFDCSASFTFQLSWFVLLFS